MNNKTGLGKGLSALIPDSVSNQGTNLVDKNKSEQDILMTPGSELRHVLLADIERNPYQPRTVFDDEKLSELTTSIQEVGVLQPILLREQNGQYELIAGERRWLAAKRAGLSSIPAVVRRIQDIESFEQAIIENLHREDLNPIDEAVAYHRLMDEFSMTQQQVAERVGRSRPAVANALRLLNLSSDLLGHLARYLILVVSSVHLNLLLECNDYTRQSTISVFKRFFRLSTHTRKYFLLSHKLTLP